MDSIIKKHFKHHLIVSSDVQRLVSKYKNLSTSVCSINDATCISIRGSIPYRFSGHIYNAPITIRLTTLYPYSPPSLLIVPTDVIKIVRGHPYVNSNGVISTPYLQSWTHKSSLIALIDQLCYLFDMKTPIYSISSASSDSHVITPVAKSDSSHLTSVVSKDQDLYSKYNLSSNFVNVVNSVNDTILAQLKDNRTNLVTQYKFNIGKYELHRMVLSSWITASLDLNAFYTDLYSMKSSLLSNLHLFRTFDLEVLDKDLDSILNKISSFNYPCSGDEDVESVVKFVDATSESLCMYIEQEATSNDMLELLHSLFKKNKISSKTYVNEMRLFSHDSFIAKLNRIRLQSTKQCAISNERVA